MPSTYGGGGLGPVQAPGNMAPRQMPGGMGQLPQSVGMQPSGGPAHMQHPAHMNQPAPLGQGVWDRCLLREDTDHMVLTVVSPDTQCDKHLHSPNNME